jgi:glycerol 2-dehydrogenase (NADP+)
VYGNEKEVGEGIKEGLAATPGLSRRDLFITTKLWCTYHTCVEKNLSISLKLLGLDYVDLYLMHWPIAMNPSGNHEKFPKLPDGSRDLVRERSHIDTYKDMEKLYRTGKVKAIGVCNYSKKYLEELLPKVNIIPAVNQIENHPRLPQTEIVDLCRRHCIHVTAYSPFGSSGSPLMQDANILQVTHDNGVTAGSVLLSYHIARGNSVIAKSVTPSRIDDNKKTINLSAADMLTLDKISNRGVTRFVYPEFGVDFGFPDKQRCVCSRQS